MTTTAAAADARETVYVAIKLNKKTWVLGILPDRERPRILGLWLERRSRRQRYPCVLPRLAPGASVGNPVRILSSGFVH